MISAAEQAALLKRFMEADLMDESDDLVIVQDFDVLYNRLQSLRNQFPTHCLHAVAIKSNPLSGVLSFLNQQVFCAEAASLQEVKLAMHSGFKPESIVFDSPVKTKREIHWMLENASGATVNIDSLEELERYPKQHSLKMGLRITVGYKTASDPSLDVSGKSGKFGIWHERETELLKAVEMHSSITDLHIHQGSQIGALENQVKGIRRVVDLALWINESLGTQRIKRINIGGGFPVNYSGDPFEIATYANLLKAECPELWNGTFEVLTEFGRYTHAHAGWLASRIEYVKQEGENQILITHSGADILLRESYQEGKWPHKLSVCRPDGELVRGLDLNTQVAGPLCFGGDFPFRNVALPKAKSGDWLLISDTGANSFALWSKHCSRAFPKVLAKNGTAISMLKDKEKDDDVIRFWS